MSLRACMALSLSCLLPLSGCGLAFSKSQFMAATGEGKLVRGQTPEQVRALVGKPDRTQAGTANHQKVDVWVYNQTSHDDVRDYIAYAMLTFGIYGLWPVGASEPHYVVFADDRLVSWDLVPQEWGGDMARLAPAPAAPRQLAPENPELATTRTGTGFSVGHGYVLTNLHVVTGMSRVTVDLADGTHFAQVVQFDEGNDIAILKIEGGGPSETPRLHLGDATTMRPGDRVWTLGYPLAPVLGERPVLTEGSISSLSGLKGDPRLFQISVPIQPGNSGGPLFNDRGDVVGITVASLNAAQMLKQTGAVPQNVNFAVKIHFAKMMLNLIPNAEHLFAQDSPDMRSASLAQQAERVMPAVALIKASQ
jgi:S1-C subfamily serine protease